MVFAAARIDPQDDNQNTIPSRNEPRSAYAGQGSHHSYPGNQQELAELPVSVTLDMANMSPLYDNPCHILGSLRFHQCQTS